MNPDPLDLDAIAQYAADAGPSTIQSAAAAHLLRKSVPSLIAAVRARDARITELETERDDLKQDRDDWRDAAIVENDNVKGLQAHIDAALAIRDQMLIYGEDNRQAEAFNRCRVKFRAALVGVPTPGSPEDHALVCVCGHKRGKHAIVLDPDEDELCMEFGCECPQFAVGVPTPAEDAKGYRCPRCGSGDRDDHTGDCYAAPAEGEK